MTEEQKIKVMTEMNRLDEGAIIDEFTQVRHTLRLILKHTITEIIQYDNDNEDNEEKIERLFKQKELIENSITSVTGIIIKLADKIIQSQRKGGQNG